VKVLYGINEEVTDYLEEKKEEIPFSSTNTQNIKNDNSKKIEK
jgi:hypothetical protein